MLKKVKKAMEVVATGVAYLRESSDDVVLNLKPRLQLDNYSCGMQALASVLHYYEREVDYDDLAETIGLTEEGCDEDQVRKAIRFYKLKHRSLRRMTLARLHKCIDDDHPVLVAPRDTHWSVVYGYGSGVVYVMDPIPKRALLRAGKADATTFVENWNRWGIEVLEPPRRRPPSRPGARPATRAKTAR